MVIKPERSPAPLRNSGRHKPSETPPRRITQKRYDMQLHAIFTELRDSIPSMTDVIGRGGEESATKDLKRGTPKTMIDEVSRHPTYDVMVLTYFRRPLYVWRESTLTSSRREIDLLQKSIKYYS